MLGTVNGSGYTTVCRWILKIDERSFERFTRSERTNDLRKPSDDGLLRALPRVWASRQALSETDDRAVCRRCALRSKPQRGGVSCLETCVVLLIHRVLTFVREAQSSSSMISVRTKRRYCAMNTHPSICIIP